MACLLHYFRNDGRNGTPPQRPRQAELEVRPRKNAVDQSHQRPPHRLRRARPLGQGKIFHSQIAPPFSQSSHQDSHIAADHTQTGDFAASAHTAHCRPRPSDSLRCHRNADVPLRVSDRAVRRGRRGMDEQVRGDEVAGNYTRGRGIPGQRSIPGLENSQTLSALSAENSLRLRLIHTNANKRRKRTRPGVETHKPASQRHWNNQ